MYFYLKYRKNLMSAVLFQMIKNLRFARRIQNLIQGRFNFGEVFVLPNQLRLFLGNAEFFIEQPNQGAVLSFSSV